MIGFFAEGLPAFSVALGSAFLSLNPQWPSRGEGRGSRRKKGERKDGEGNEWCEETGDEETGVGGEWLSRRGHGLITSAVVTRPITVSAKAATSARFII